VVEGHATFAYHVGAHKTGTSLFQSYLAENRPKLRTRRVLYVRRGIADVIARAGDDPELAEQAARHLRRFHRNRDSYDTFLASYENAIGPPFAADCPGRLYPRSAARIATLVESLRPFRPKILLSIRPVDEFVESYYLQSIHQGGYLGFDAWLERYVDLDLLSWRPLVDEIVSAFGDGAVAVVDFRLIKTHGSEVYLRELLRHVVPGPPPAVGTRPVTNASISDKGLRLALAANPHLRDRDEQKAMRRFLQAQFSNVQYPPPSLLSDQQRRMLRKRYLDDYEALVARHGHVAR
jgi:hypothetical protein